MFSAEAQSTAFSSGSERASFVTGHDLLCRSWEVIKSLNHCEKLYWKVHYEADLTIIAFATSPICTFQNLQRDLVSSSVLREKDFVTFEFLCSKTNLTFSVNEAAVSLFYENREKLDELKSKIINSFTPSLITGHALGGSVASLFTLCLLDSIGSGKKRPLCITFGSPLIGDKNFQQAISRSSTWNSCFLHVVSHKDPLPRHLITNHNSSAAEPSSQTSPYVPFGTFLLCSDVNSTCYENPDSILELLVTLGSLHDQNQGLQLIDYGNIVESLYSKAICKDSAALPENVILSNPLHASIILQLLALGFAPHMQQQQQNIDIDALVTKIKELEQKFIFQKRTYSDPSKKLNVLKIDMAQLEWYKKDSKNRGVGYYDSYKNMLSSSDLDVVRFQKNLTRYWDKMVEEAELKPQKEGVAFRTGRWLYAGTNYRRMVEPLDIAQYYKNGGKDYATNKRSRHYKQLEKWLRRWTRATSSLNTTSRQNVESILTLDSCFWAHVEEALISIKELKDPKASATEKAEARKKLNKFEEYVYGLLKNYAVSPEIFLEQSSYMRWWNEYKIILGNSYNSALSSFMSNPSYRKQYTVGAFDFV